MIQSTDDNFIACLPRLADRSAKAKHQIGGCWTKNNVVRTWRIEQSRDRLPRGVHDLHGFLAGKIRRTQIGVVR